MKRQVDGRPLSRDPNWQVGELARSAGLTVRTLHHWDDLGLVSPSRRGANGYRLYGEEDVRRLYQVLALRRLGLPLSRIADAIDGQADLADLMRRHLAVVEQELAEAAALRERLAALLAYLERGTEPAAAELLDVLEHMAMVERYYTPEQLEELARRREALGPEGMADAQRQWAELIDAARREHDKGTDPAAASVRALALRWHALIEAFTGGDPETRRNLQRLYDEQGPERASRGMAHPELMDYLRKAMEAAGLGET